MLQLKYYKYIISKNSKIIFLYSTWKILLLEQKRKRGKRWRGDVGNSGGQIIKHACRSKWVNNEDKLEEQEKEWVDWVVKKELEEANGRRGGWDKLLQKPYIYVIQLLHSKSLISVQYISLILSKDYTLYCW